MIGLCDYTLLTAKNLSPPNLEIMKLATYYKTEENTFCRLVSLSETELSVYDKIYVFSEQDEIPIMPPAFLTAPNVIYGGTTFTNGIYQPFENQLIDYTIPKKSIYKEFLKQRYQEGAKANEISHILDDSYYRHYAGENELPLVPILKNKRMFLYDKDLFQPRWKEKLDEIIARKPSGIFCIHPVICKKLDNYFYIRQLTRFARTNPVVLDLNIPLSDVPYLLKKYERHFLADITKTSSVYLYLGGSFVSNFQYYKDFIYKMNLLYSFWSRNIPIRIKYCQPNAGFKDPLYFLSKFIETWSKNIENTRTINEHIVYKDKKRISEEQIARDQLLKFYPAAADLFSQTYEQLVQRRYWRI